MRRELRIGLLILAALVWAVNEWRAREVAPPPGEATAVEGAWEQRLSGVMVRFEGTVDRVLADDDHGSRHQRFIVRLASGHTVLVAHNIDLAERVPLSLHDRIGVYGEYEWNDRGGVVHWTHRDPQGRREGGWVEHGGRRYR